jgi:flagellar hook assembly protein FlgD
MSQSDTLVINLKNNQVEKIAISQIQKITFENVTSVKEQNKSTNNVVIKGNYPNPFQNQTSIEFEIPISGNVIIFIYDNKGNQIQKLECSDCQTGKNSIEWNCLDIRNKRVLSGVYYYEVRFGNESKTKKMLIIK